MLCDTHIVFSEKVNIGKDAVRSNKKDHSRVFCDLFSTLRFFITAEDPLHMELVGQVVPVTGFSSAF
jgi:hypothetical protein